MRQITFLLNCNIEERLRKYTGRKGDLSKILNEAVKLWLDQKEGLVGCVQKENEGKQ
jgi:hypothetical protein